MGNVDRCKGFSAHLMKLLIRQRRSLTTLTEQWIILRYVHVPRGLASALWSGLEPREVGRVFLSTTSFDARYYAWTDEKRSVGASSGPSKNNGKSSVSWVWNEDVHCGYADGQGCGFGRKASQSLGWDWVCLYQACRFLQ